MYYLQLVKRLASDIFLLFSIIMSILLIYFQMIPFVEAAIALKMLNAQTISYTVFTLLLLILPLVMIAGFRRISKRNVLSAVFYSFAAIIFIGTVSDMLSFHGLIGYQFSEGDAVFVNMMWNMPNIFGVLFSLIIVVLYIFLGNKIKHVRRISYKLFLSITVLSVTVPFIYSYLMTGSLPRQTWLDKAGYIIPEYLFLLVTFSIVASSREIWVKHIW